MNTCIFIAAGGFLGAISRYYLSGYLQTKHTLPLPLGTLVINLLGSFLLGLLLGLSINSPTYSFLATGFLGAFTTFSTFELEAVELFRKGLVKLALFYLAASVLLGLALAALGYWLGKTL